MAIHSTIRPLIAFVLLFATGYAQTPSGQDAPAAPCPTQNQSPNPPAAPDQNPGQAAKPCIPPAKKSAAQQFPFPGEPAKPASPPDSPAPATTPSSAAAQHPFPTQPSPKLPGDDSSSNSSSSSGDDPGAAIPGDTPTPGGDPPEGTSVHRKLPKVKAVKTDDERVDEDLRVSKFYLNDENYQGAYLRAKDAVQIQPEYSATHFALAEIARKMKKKEEAIAEYQTYLKLDPDGEKARDAKKALAELQ